MKKKHPQPLYKGRSSSIHGRGVFAVRRIRPGQRIIEYKGERVSNAEADRRYPENGASHSHTVLFALDKKMCIDAGRQGNAARFINHSCKPNCESIVEAGRVFIEAIRNIQPGAELSYDYKLTDATPRTKAERESYACHCAAPNCRGTILERRTPRKRRRRKQTA